MRRCMPAALGLIYMAVPLFPSFITFTGVAFPGVSLLPGAAIVAVARKLAALSWQLLTKQEDYAFKRRSLVEKKLRNVELRAGAPRQQTKRRGEMTGRDRVQQEQQLTHHPAGRAGLPTTRQRLEGLTASERRCGRRTGAHLNSPRRAKPRGRHQPHRLRFRSQITRTTTSIPPTPDQSRANDS